MTLSVLILTRDEQVNLPGCLASLGWCDDIVVLDSFSNDNTVGIAEQHGARVLRREFDNYAGQRNFGLTQIEYKNPWVLMLDADERVSPELKTELLSALASVPTTVSMLAMRRKDFFLGKWIRRSSGYPTWFGRVARLGEVWVERPINEEYHTKGSTLYLQTHLHHYPFNKGFSAWISKHDRYSTMEAELLSENRSNAESANLVSKDAFQRRKALKQIVYRLPARPLIVFMALYFLRGGFLEGRAGLVFSALRAWYEFMIDCKVIEISLRRNRQPI